MQVDFLDFLDLPWIHYCHTEGSVDRFVSNFIEPHSFYIHISLQQSFIPSTQQCIVHPSQTTILEAVLLFLADLGSGTSLHEPYSIVQEIYTVACGRNTVSTVTLSWRSFYLQQAEAAQAPG